jgi:predicted ester cyclase
MTTEKTTENLAAVYRRYLQCLNERRWNDLHEFVRENLTYNAQPMTLVDYRAARQAETQAIPDLRFTADLVVTSADTVAARLFFRCTPQQPFLGFEPTGTQISFVEHVFYSFHDEKIEQVWSLIDTSAIAAQTAGRVS